MINKSKQGKKNRLKGAAFERKVRKYLENEGWIVDKWTNNVEDGKLRPARTNMFNSRSCGFPDFICFKIQESNYSVMAVECKTGKYLDKEEKAKVQWYLDNKIFGKIYVAYDDDGEIKFIQMKEFIQMKGGKNEKVE